MLKIGQKVKIYKRSENTNAWLELKDDRGNPYKGIIKGFSHNGEGEPIFARVQFQENESLYSEELLAINSNRFKLGNC